MTEPAAEGLDETVRAAPGVPGSHADAPRNATAPPAPRPVLGADASLVEALLKLGGALEQSSDYPLAMARFGEALTRARVGGDARGEARALLGMAKVEHATGESELAVEHLAMAMSAIERVGDDGLGAELLHQLGMAHRRLERLDDAEAMLEAALARRRAAGDTAGIATTLNSLGVLALHRGNLAEADADAARAQFALARTRYEEALGLARTVDDRHLEALALGNVGTAAGSLGDFALALELFHRQLDALREIGDAQNEALALTNIGEAERRLGAHDRAIAALNEALKVAGRCGSLPRALAAHRELSAACEAAERFEPALHHHKAFHELDVKVRSADAERRAAQLAARVAVAEARREAEAVRAERDRLQVDNDELAREAMTDPLTGLGNRRAFERSLARALRGRPAELALLAIDLDHFKAVNDTFTHLVGDDVLRRVADVLLEQLRPGDPAFRIGGEEFAVLLHGGSALSAAAIGERVRRAVALHAWHEVVRGLAVTVSVGVAAARDADADGNAAETLRLRADRALYAAKDAGRDRVVVAETA